MTEHKEETGDKTETFMLPLNDAERVTELATMLSGNDPGEAAIQNARELLGKSFKV